MKSRQTGIAIPLVFAAAALIAAALGCKDSNTITGTAATPTSAPPSSRTPTSTASPSKTSTAIPAGTATPTPTPGPLVQADVSGAWTGTFKVGNWPGYRGCSETVQADATFSQHGSQVTGMLNARSARCGFYNVKFTGSTYFGGLHGALGGGPFGPAGAEARGTLTTSPPPESAK